MHWTKSDICYTFSSTEYIEDIPFLHVLYISCKGHMTFCGIFPKVKELLRVSLNFLLPDMPYVIPHTLEYRECELYIMISFSVTCHVSPCILELRSIPHGLLLAGVR